MSEEFWKAKEIDGGIDQLVEICLDIQESFKWLEQHFPKETFSNSSLFRCVACKLCNDLYDFAIAKDKNNSCINSLDYVFKKMSNIPGIEKIKSYGDKRIIPKSESPLLGKSIFEDLQISDVKGETIKKGISGLKHNYTDKMSPLLSIGYIVTMNDIKNFCNFVFSIAQLIYRAIRPGSDIHMERM